LAYNTSPYNYNSSCKLKKRILKKAVLICKKYERKEGRYLRI